VRRAWLVLAVLLAVAGVAMRAGELGTFGFSNDEAWVALATRVEGFRQFWMAIVMTPIAWAVLLKAVSLVHLSETALRSVPFAFGCLTLWIAYRAGRRFAGHPLGGVLALAAVAFDPLAVAYAKVLKQYTAETFFCLLALDRAAAFAETRTRRDLARVAAVLMLGLCFANAQVFVAPPVCAALLLDALVRRERRGTRDLLVMATAVGLWDAVYYLLLIAPRLPDQTDPYWGMQQYLPVGLAAARIGWGRLSWTLQPALGAVTLPVALVALVAGCVQRRQRVAATTLVLLVLEIAGLSMCGLMPVSQPRILLFLTTTLAAFAAAALGGLVARAWTRPALGLGATIALAILASDFVAAHQWRQLRRQRFVEDAGPLVRLEEEQRRGDEGLLLHAKTFFIYGYYQRAVPRLMPARGVSTRYLPRFADPTIVPVDGRTLAERGEAALRTHPRAWLLASRLGRADEVALRRVLARFGTIVRENRRRGAFLLLIESRTGTPAPGR
jgi:hypothetical protein